MKHPVWLNGSLLALMFISACSIETTEMARVSSQNGEMDAVVAIRETDATVSTPTEVYIVAAGAKVNGEPIFRADKVVGARVVWSDNKTLVVHADKARVFLKKTTYEVPVVDAQRQIDVRYEIGNEF